MKELLPLLPRPTRYLGSEWGVVKKDPEAVRVRIAVGFPDLYEVGMSYLGQRILLHQVNRCEGFLAERVYTPCEETAALLREKGVPLATLETDTPLTEVDALSFSLTHELCYTNVLWMLDLAGIPRRTADRDESHPLIVAGGGACFNAEPLAPFIDVMMIGDGEEAVVTLMEELDRAKRDGLSRHELLHALIKHPGFYVPSFFEDQGPDKPLKPLVEGYETVEKAVVEDLDSVGFPTLQPISFGQAVHDRLTVEIARGCTRGCRFCQAGMIYRPVRERSLDELNRVIFDGLAETGYEETSFLSLSTGDFSALDSLFSHSFDRCAAEQISIALPSLRVGSLSGPIMERISTIRRTGATLAPEAGSQRLRDAINKGVDEQGLLDHVLMLFENGWQSVKLYFMIGLPTETDEDLDAILDLCLKVRDAAGRHIKRLQVTAAVSPFVPKPQTPFQWDAQITLDEIERRIDHLRAIFRPHKRVRLRFHIPRMTFLEGIFSRGDRRLADVLEIATDKGALFSSWKDKLDLQPYMEAMEACGLDPLQYTGPRDPEGPLPWDHLSAGLTKRFLLKERERALSGKITGDCRYEVCRNCGVCNHDNRRSILTSQTESMDIHPRMINESRDQEGEQPPFSVEKPDLTIKGGHYRLWFEKTGPAAYLSQLELQSVFERAMRRAELPLTFSGGFHPMPRLSFGRALPVGVYSRCEWLNLFLREEWEPVDLIKRLAPQMPEGFRLLKADVLGMGKKQPQQVEEVFEIAFINRADELREQWKAFRESSDLMIERTNKKGKVKQVNLRAFVSEVEDTDEGVRLVFDWRNGYMSPLRLAQEVMPGATLVDFCMTKTAQRF
ncbi:TIGR03960 family B12-binding radical SAM protein [Salidesulfovibrio brasiliensis]|uniref:TIGR03960 family B12-binding radical SAM protein n=1 Tax=Salidesulfovibrio brasiliensis TaxID=221711 RepID=UPI0006CF6DD3|nr:TIGR03960 family B12-binding radical SAM protein [Salidesulfovibrio brasiliensis]